MAAPAVLGSLVDVRTGGLVILRMLLANFVSMLPGNAVRVLLYRLLFGYRIRGARIGWRTVIVVKEAELEGCRIGHHNRIVGPLVFVARAGAAVGHHNTFECGWWTQDNGSAGYDPRIELREGSLVNNGHTFDLAGTVILGRESIVAGIHSQFWTHGPGTSKRHIHVGDHCYIGSHTLFAPGSGLASNTMVAMGSLIARPFRRPNVVVGGVPAIVLRENYDWSGHRPIAAESPAAGPGPVQAGDDLADYGLEA